MSFPCARQRVDRQHRELLAALAGAARQLLVHAPGRPAPQQRTGPVPLGARPRLDAGRPSAGGPTTCFASDGAVARPRRLVRCRPARLAVPATEQEHRLRALLATRPSRSGWPHSADPVLAAGASGRRGRAATASPASTATWPASPSRRRSRRRRRRPGSSAGPPARSAYLVQEILGVETVENPEDELEITPTRPGRPDPRGLRTVHPRGARPSAGEQPGPDDPWSAIDRDRMAGHRRRALRRVRAQGPHRPADLLAPRPQADPRRPRSASSTDDSSHRRAASHPPARRRAGLRSPGSEPRRRPAVSWPTGGPCTSGARPTGSTSSDDGTLHVVDYKTGKPTTFEDLTRRTRTCSGRKLQLPVYGAAARIASRRRPTPRCRPSTGSSRPRASSSASATR